MSAWSALCTLFGRLRRSRGGNMLVVGGLAAPVAAVLATAALDFANGVNLQMALQRTADAAALAAAQELSLRSTEDSQVQAIVAAYVANNLSLPEGAEITRLDAAILGGRAGVSVRLSAELSPVLAAAFGRRNVRLDASATARLGGSVPLCVLTLSRGAANAVALRHGAHLSANGCAVAVNSSHRRSLVVDAQSQLVATAACTAGGTRGSSGSFEPAPLTDCPTIADPLASRPTPEIGGCDFTNHQVKGRGRSFTLRPGVYCGGLSILTDVRVTLEPGVYVIKDGIFHVRGRAQLTGEQVALQFAGAQSGFRFDSQTRIRLTAPESGPLAGFLMFGDRIERGRAFEINSNDARELLGTIYLPKAVLRIAAANPVADQSAFTVIVTDQLVLEGGPELTLNSDYESSNVPVPEGVGPTSGDAFLAR